MHVCTDNFVQDKVSFKIKQVDIAGYRTDPMETPYPHTCHVPETFKAFKPN